MNANCSRFAAACGLHRMIFTPLALAVSAAPAALKILIVFSCAAAALAAPRQRLGPGPVLSVHEIPLPELKSQAHGPLSSLHHPFEPRLGSLSPSACTGQCSTYSTDGMASHSTSPLYVPLCWAGLKLFRGLWYSIQPELATFSAYAWSGPRQTI